ncbi:type II secretion system protein [Pseudoalteromonas gelatinilytica]
MMSPSKVKGFSLIELMVVMAIMAVLMGLTGGVIVKNVAQQTRLVELEKTQNYFKMLSYKAYYGGYPITVDLDGRKFKISFADQVTNLEFEELEFEKARYTINTKSAIMPSTFSVKWNDSSREFHIKTMFKPYE